MSVESNLRFHSFLDRSSQLVVYLYDRRKVIGRIAAVLFLAIAATVGIATIRNGSEVRVTNSKPVEAPVNVRKTETTTPSKSLPEHNIPATPILDAPLIGESGFSLGPAQPYDEPSSQAKPTAKVEEVPTPIKPKSEPSPLPAPVTETAQQVTPEPAATQKTFLEISVAVKVEDGHVTEAYVTNRQPGAPAFESTALHIARQRRYPPGTSLTETIVLRVANQLGRKEP
jgi:hypothetical protein